MTHSLTSETEEDEGEGSSETTTLDSTETDFSGLEEDPRSAQAASLAFQSSSSTTTPVTAPTGPLSSVNPGHHPTPSSGTIDDLKGPPLAPSDSNPHHHLHPQGDNEVDEGLVQVKNRLNHALEEERGLLAKKMDLLLEKRNLELEVQRLELERELGALAARRDELEREKVFIV